MQHFVKHKYTDKATVTVEWFEPWDGPWKQKTQHLTVEHDHPFYQGELGQESN
jgi:hypothetical protein